MNTIAIIISTIIFVIFILWCNCFYYIWRNLVFYYNNRLSYSDNNLYSLYDILKKYNISYDDVLSVHSFVNYWKTKELGLCKDNYASKEDKNSIESLTRVIITVSNDGVNTAYVFFGNIFRI